MEKIAHLIKPSAEPTATAEPTDEPRPTAKPSAKPTAEPGKSGQTDVAEPEFVYVLEYVDVKGEFQNSFDSLIYHDGRFLTSMYGKIGERELEEGEELQWEGQNWIWGNRLYWLSLDGTLQEITGYEPITLDAGEESPAEGEEPAEKPEELFAELFAEPLTEPLG